MNGERISDETEYAVWLVWKLHENQPVLVAIDTSPERAERHAAYVRAEADLLKKPPPELFIEESKTNHLYGQSVSDLVSFKLSSLLAKERSSP